MLFRSIAALVVAIVVMRAGYKLSKRTFDILIDTAPEGVEELVREIGEKNENVLKVERVRVRHVGTITFVEISIKIDRKLSLEKAKEIGKEIEEEIKTKVDDADVTIREILSEN